MASRRGHKRTRKSISGGSSPAIQRRERLGARRVMNVWDAVAAATPVEKPAVATSTQKTPYPASLTPTTFDPNAVLDELSLYWLNGSSSYFLRRIDRGYARYIEMASAEIRRKLR